MTFIGYKQTDKPNLYIDEIYISSIMLDIRRNEQNNSRQVRQETQCKINI